jgi:hypothetical protein
LRRVSIGIYLSRAAGWTLRNVVMRRHHARDWRGLAWQSPLLVESQEASMSKLTAEQKVREYNRGQKAAKKGRSRYWSEPSAYPFESDEHYQGRTEAFDQGYDDQFWHELRARSFS